MKVRNIILMALSCASFTLQAQGVMDAVKYSQTDILGSARYMSMAGAFGALGGDVSAISLNPAGIGVFRSSEIMTTLNLSTTYTSATNSAGVSKDSDINFMFNNFGYVGTLNTSNNSGWANFNVGFSYNKIASFNRSYKTSYNNIGTSLTNYIAEVTNYDIEQNGAIPPSDMVNDKNPETPYFDTNIPWLTTLAYNGFLIDPVDNGGNAYTGFFSPSLGDKANANLLMRESGDVSEYAISVGGNYGHRFYIGATVGLIDLRYTMRSEYGENITFQDGSNASISHTGSFALRNYLSTKGNGVNFKLGIIARPTDNLRLGFAVHTPTAYEALDYYDATLDYTKMGFDSGNGQAITGTTYTPADVYSSYYLNTPWRIMGSAAYTIGKKGLISVDYEFTGYKDTKLSDYVGDLPATYLMGEQLLNGNTIKVGGEYRVTPQLSARVGYALQMSPIASSVLNQELVVETAGTVTQYTLDRDTHYYTCGLGYRYGSVYADLAYVRKENDQDLLPFSPINGLFPEVTKLATATNSFALTVGYKF